MIVGRVKAGLKRARAEGIETHKNLSQNLPPLCKGRLGGVESRPAATDHVGEHSHGSPPALRPPLPLLTKEGNRQSVEMPEA
jgi:hypothetical protein